MWVKFNRKQETSKVDLKRGGFPHPQISNSTLSACLTACPLFVEQIEAPPIVFNTFFHIKVQNDFEFNISLTSNNKWSISKNGSYSYVWQNSLPHSLKIKTSPVPVASLTWNFVQRYFDPFINVRNKISETITS